MQKKYKARLVIEMTPNEVRAIKVNAALRNITMKEFVLQAVRMRLDREIVKE